MSDVVRDKIYGLLEEHAGVRARDILGINTLEGDLGMDDLDKVEFILAVEDEWGFEVLDEDEGRMGTVDETVDYIKGRIKEKSDRKEKGLS